ncbi:MAG: glutamate racemase [Acidimicrobiia bacterium]|nr:glutamate racemase [Acidimicrobiia bacterium]MDH3462058.1 glutamate racemase [Acidimicrobiia bacterium]
MIGIFDSGLGGLGVLREMIPLFVDETLVYVADRARAPYGSRSLAEVRELSHAIGSGLIEEGASTIVVACNTASAGALSSLRSQFPTTKFVGMEPAVKPAAQATRSGIIGVLATEVTFQGELFSSLADQYASDLTILTRAAPEWVQLVERGLVDGPEVEASVKEQVDPLIKRGADTLVLGCTHFPFLSAAIRAAAGGEVSIIDPAPAVALQARRIHVDSGAGPDLRARVSGSIEDFAALSRTIAGIEFSGGVLPLRGDDRVQT